MSIYEFWGELEMNFIKRAFLSVKARKGKSLLQIFIFTAICVLVLAGLSIQTAAEKSADSARQKLGADITLQVDMEKMRENMQNQKTEGERPRFTSTPIPVDTAEELISSDQLKGYNFYSSTTALATNFEPIESETSITSDENTNAPEREMPGRGMSQGDISLQGVIFTDSTSEFIDNMSSIIEGRHLTDADIDQNVTIIEQTLAEENALTLGDTVSITNPTDESLTLDLKIVGIYKTTSNGSDMAMNFTALNPYNKLYVPYTAASELKGSDYAGTIDSAIYYLDDPAQLEDFVTEAKETSSIDFDTFTLDANDQLYQQMVGPIENVSSFSNNLVYLVSIAGAIILGLIVMMSIRERKYEMGVLLALGEKRWKLVGQFITEILVVAVLALGIATMSGNLVANQIGDQLLNQELSSTEQANTPESFRGRGGMGFSPGMGAQQVQQEAETIETLDVQVTTNDLSILALIGILIAILSTLLPSISVLRLQPKTILTKQE